MEVSKLFKGVFVVENFKQKIIFNRQLPLWTNFKTRQGDGNKSPQLERAY